MLLRRAFFSISRFLELRMIDLSTLESLQDVFNRVRIPGVNIFGTGTFFYITVVVALRQLR